MITFLIIGITVLISVVAFGNYTIMERFIFRPAETGPGKWYRFFTYGVLHADYAHLIFNMFTLYFFGGVIEHTFKTVLGDQTGVICYLLLYLTALPISILPTYFKQKNNTNYRGLGASGAVSAVIFAYILIHPMNFMGILFIPIWLPAFFSAPSSCSSLSHSTKTGRGINHPHITGSLYGIAFTVILFMALADINLIGEFAQKISIHSVGDLLRFGY